MRVETLLWLLALAVGVFLLDRLLLWIESRGWIYYRRNKPGRGASTYHLFEWNAAFDPTMRQVQEERVREEREEEESGAPPGSGGEGDRTEGGEETLPGKRTETEGRRSGGDVGEPGNGGERLP
jgi:hypothetical protein